jgi:hypothetical protein
MLLCASDVVMYTIVYNIHCRRDYRLFQLLPGAEDATPHPVVWRCANESIVYEVSNNQIQSFLTIRLSRPLLLLPNRLMLQLLFRKENKFK